MRPSPTWQRELGEAVGSLSELLELLELEPEEVGASAAAARHFPLRVPHSFVRRMVKGSPGDPLLLQVLPTVREVEEVPGFTRDPLGEAAMAPAPGVLHKYRGRALVVVTGACAVHCRYCFRRHFPYGEHRSDGAWEEEVVRYLAERPVVEEVVLSGGDPLSVADDKLAGLVRALEEGVPQLRRLRVHTRLPVVLPSRVDDGLLEWLADIRLTTVVVLHANHPHEVDDEVAASARRLRRAASAVLNQSVLLAGVNDSADALCALSERLFEAGVLPYYLHVLDPVAGAAHFQVKEGRARALLREVAGRLPGYLVPRLVREVPGEPAKVPLSW